jgi:hypothetical protein
MKYITPIIALFALLLPLNVHAQYDAPWSPSWYDYGVQSQHLLNLEESERQLEAQKQKDKQQQVQTTPQTPPDQQAQTPATSTQTEAPAQSALDAQTTTDNKRSAVSKYIIGAAAVAATGIYLYRRKKDETGIDETDKNG